MLKFFKQCQDKMGNCSIFCILIDVGIEKWEQMSRECQDTMVNFFLS